MEEELQQPITSITIFDIYASDSALHQRITEHAALSLSENLSIAYIGLREDLAEGEKHRNSSSLFFLKARVNSAYGINFGPDNKYILGRFLCAREGAEVVKYKRFSLSLEEEENLYAARR